MRALQIAMRCEEASQESAQQRVYRSPVIYIRQTYRVSHCVVAVTGLFAINALYIYCPAGIVKSALSWESDLSQKCPNFQLYTWESSTQQSWHDVKSDG